MFSAIGRPKYEIVFHNYLVNQSIFHMFVSCLYTFCIFFHIFRILKIIDMIFQSSSGVPKSKSDQKEIYGKGTMYLFFYSVLAIFSLFIYDGPGRVLPGQILV